MPIITIPSSSPVSATTTTGADILQCIAYDLQERFATGPRETLLLSYIDRAQGTILSRRKWNWMLSAPQRFITERGQTEYWIGPAGITPDGAVNTGLGLSDVRHIKSGAVFNRSGWTTLGIADEAPNLPGWQNPDGSYAESKPRQYRNDRTTPYLISLYPAPDSGDDFEIKPAAPHSTVAAGGALSARTYYLRVTFVDEAGNESAASNTARQWIGASELLTVKAPQPELGVGSAGITFNRWSIYAGTTEGSETLQQANISINDDWTEGGSGLTTNGATPPSASSIEPISGYVVEFRYYKAHTKIDATDDVLLIPDEWADVVCLGANYYAAQYLHRSGSVQDPEVAFWKNEFEEGIADMIRDQNPWPGQGQWMAPDTDALRNKTWH